MGGGFIRQIINNKQNTKHMGYIIWGILFIIGGASGSFVLRGTDSCGALIALGVGFIGWGVFRLIADNKEK